MIRPHRLGSAVGQIDGLQLLCGPARGSTSSSCRAGARTALRQLQHLQVPKRSSDAPSSLPRPLAVLPQRGNTRRQATVGARGNDVRCRSSEPMASASAVVAINPFSA